MLFAIHATAGADPDNAPAEGEAAVKPAKPERLCAKSEKLELVAGQLADLQHIPPSPELILKAREAGVDANPVYAKFGVTGEFDSFKKWLEDLKETADAPLICGRARSGERIVLVAAVRAGTPRALRDASPSTGETTEPRSRSRSNGTVRCSCNSSQRAPTDRAPLRSAGWARSRRTSRQGLPVGARSRPKHG
jgi:hypothetical protein